MDDVVAVILAGGRGKRLKPITDYIPKPMLPVGKAEKPVLEYLINWIKKYNIEDFIFLVGYKYKQIVNYFREGERWNVNITYSVDDQKYKGTGGALLKAYKNNMFKKYNYILVWYGDIIAQVDLNDLINKCGKNEAIIVAVKDYKLPVGVLKVKDDYITNISEKPKLDQFVGIGIHLFSNTLMKYLTKMGKSNFDIGSHYLPFLLKKGIKIKIYHYSKTWIDIGSYFRYEDSLSLDLK